MKTLDPEALRAARLQAQRLRQRRERRRALLQHACLILASFEMLYPLLWMVASSFKPESEIFSDLAIWTWDDFLGPLIYLNNIANYTVPLALRTFVDSTGVPAWGQLFATSTLSLLPLFVFFLLFQRLIIRGVAMSAMKR
jgi:ABC-type glycerol-3-phosphate transport system permease component